MKPTKHLSVVTSMYRSAPYLEEFYRRISKAAGEITADFEIIFVDDGSPDNSSEIIRAIAATDNRVRLVRLSRNFGHHNAILAGIRHARGAYVFFGDCDLEEPPEILTTFYSVLTSHPEKPAMAYGHQPKRQGGWVKRTTGTLFYRFFNLLTGIRLPQNEVSSHLMTREYCDSLLQYADESHILLAGILQLTGYRQVGIAVEKSHKGSTTYTLKKKIITTLDAVTSFSSIPLIYISIFGVGVSFVAALMVVYLISRRLYYGELLLGWTSVIASVWMLGGICITCIGVVGLYVGKIFVQVKHRPTMIVQELVN